MMEELQTIGSSIKELLAFLHEPHFEPDPSRTDWAQQKAALEHLSQRIEREVLTPLQESKPQNPEEEAILLMLRRGAALLLGIVAALLYASKDASGASRRLTQAQALTNEGGELSQELTAAAGDMSAFTALQYSRWLRRESKQKRAQQILTEAIPKAQSQALRELLKKELKESKEDLQPITTAPALVSFNGFGVGIYGSRDRAEDGTYVTTHCVSVLFIPVFPLAAYRVYDHGNDRYAFLGKVPLSPFAKVYRALVLVLVLGGLLMAGVSGYLNSPTRLSKIALQEALQAEASGDTKAATASYEKLLQDFGLTGDQDALNEASAHLLGLYLKEIQEPFQVESVEQATRVIFRYQALPLSVQNQKAGDLVVGALLRWVEQLGDKTPEATSAARQLLKLAKDIPSASKDTVKEKEKSLTISFANSLAQDWPLLALELYREADSYQASAAALTAIQNLGESPSFLLEAEPLFTWWITESRSNATLGEAAKALEEKVSKARAALSSPERAAALASGKEEALKASLEKLPGDQQMALSLADALRAKGQSKEAIALLEKLGPPGRLIEEARQLLISLYLSEGRLEEVELIVSRYLSVALPKFQEAKRKYDQAIDAKVHEIQATLESGRLPPQLLSQLDSASEERQSELIQKWMKDQISYDARLERLRSEYEQFSGVVPAALTLGMAKLQRAQTTQGDTRKKLLAEAERAFLAIRTEAEGVPAFHLGLGQVYHRLGKIEEGEKELRAILDQNDPELTMAVCDVYRELGLVVRAREIASSLWEKTEEPHKTNAASFMAATANSLEEKEAWLKKADPKDSFIKISLDEVQGQKLYQEGKFQEAEGIFARVAAAFEEQAAHNPAAANNAALAHTKRYLCLGKEELLEKGVQGLEAALRLAPENSIIMSNLASQLSYVGMLKILRRWIDISTLHLEGGDAEALLFSLASGPLREEVLAAAQKEPYLKRSLLLSQQGAALAPKDPEPYSQERKWYELLQSIEDLKKLKTKLSLLEGGLDTTAEDQARKELQTGEQDSVFLEYYNTDLLRIDAAIKAATQKNDPQTLAAAYYIRSLVSMRMATVGNQLSDVESALQSATASKKHWPELSAKKKNEWVLILGAILQAQKTSSLVSEAWDKERRLYGVSAFLVRSLNNPALLGAIRSQPQFQEALSRVAEKAKEKATIDSWIIAKAADDASLVQTLEPAFTQEEERLSIELDALLSPGSLSAAEMLKLIQSKP